MTGRLLPVSGGATSASAPRMLGGMNLAVAVPDAGDPVLSGGPWQCHCGQVRSHTLMWWWAMGDEIHTANRCTDYGEIILPDGAAN